MGAGLNRRLSRPTTWGAMSSCTSTATPALSFVVEQCDIPAELTLAEWRRRCAAERRAAREAERGSGGRVRRGVRRALRRG